MGATATPAAAAAPVAAPAAAAASSVATPATSSAAVDTSASSSSPELASVTVSDAGQHGGESEENFFTRGLTASLQPKTEEPAAAEPAAVEEPAVTEEPAQTEEPATEEPAAAEETEEGSDPYEDLPGPLSPRDLNAKLKANPELAAAIDADPDFKNSLFASSRLAAETAQFKEVFANAEEAKVAAQASQQFTDLSDLVTNIQKPEDAQAFYGKLMELSILHDEDGNPVIDQKSGKPMSDGTVGRLIEQTGSLFLDHFGREAEAKNDPELQAAVDILKARAFGSGAASTPEDMTAEQQARAAELDARENALKEEKQQAQKAKVDSFNQSVTSGIDTFTDAEITRILGRTDLPEQDRAGVMDKIREAVYEKIVANPNFKIEQDSLTRRPMGEKTKVARIGLGKKYVGMLLGKVANEVIAQSGAKLVAKQEKNQQTQAARVEASRSEASGTLRTARPVTAQTGQDVAKIAMDNLTKKLGRQPTMTESLMEVNRLKTAGQ